MISISNNSIRGDVDGLFTFQLLARQDSLALPRAGRGSDFPAHPVYTYIGNLIAFNALCLYRFK